MSGNKIMDEESISTLLITANVGSLFEDPSTLLKIWIKEFLEKVTTLKPSFIALHLQEVGGKTYEKSMEYVQEFLKNLCESAELENFNRIRIFLDEDYHSAEHFTALGSLYFALKTIDECNIWNFLTHEWEVVEGKNIHTGNIETVATKEKSKFPQHFFPECKWSRKGFLRTRWSINGTVLDLVNIHLFHDASNLAACEEFPSVYCKSRRRALVHTLERFQKDLKNNPAPYFVFGDFNFRCDTEGVVKELTENLTTHRITNLKNDNTKVQYRNSGGQNVLTIGKKEFTHAEHQNKFKEEWLRKYDRELDPLKNILFEYPIKFPPSYPYEEDPEYPESYMHTRCPAWCDRILVNPAAKKLIFNYSDNYIYDIIGGEVCMGDHKPIYLHIRIKSKQGRVCCFCGNFLNQQQHKHIYSSANAKNATCLYCNDLFSKTIIECKKLYGNNNEEENDEEVKKLCIKMKIFKKPLVSINLTDTENNLNVCMCSVFDSNDDMLSMKLLDGTICSRCCNIIKQQPVEHRKMLVSKKLLLANDIIVNRIDSHYLSTTSGIGAEGHKKPDPYTPESIESHSPQPEFFEKEINETICDDELIKLHQSKSTGVSPRQLKSRLEILKNESQNSDIDKGRRKTKKLKSNNCCPYYCVIL